MVCLGLEPRAADYAAMFFFWLYTFYSFKVLEAHLIGIFMGNGCGNVVRADVASNTRQVQGSNSDLGHLKDQDFQAFAVKT